MMTRFDVYKRKRAKRENDKKKQSVSLRAFSEALRQDLEKAGYYS